MTNTTTETKGIASYHPVIEQMEKLDPYEQSVEARKLIVRCIEEGILPWSNPAFLRFYWMTVEDFVAGGPRLERYMLRGVMYARLACDRMPTGIDDEMLANFQRLAEGQPLEVRELKGGPWKGQLQGHQCAWPSYRGNLWKGAFLVQCARRVDTRIRIDLALAKVRMRRAA